MKVYLSRSMTRSMSIDHPVGDPFGGPAFAEKRDPVSAIVAVGSFLAGDAIVAAIGAEVLAGIAIASTAATVVGRLTGNSFLSDVGKIGGAFAGGASLGSMDWQNLFASAKDTAAQSTASQQLGQTAVESGGDTLAQTPSAVGEAAADASQTLGQSVDMNALSSPKSQINQIGPTAQQAGVQAPLGTAGQVDPTASLGGSQALSQNSYDIGIGVDLLGAPPSLLDKAQMYGSKGLDMLGGAAKGLGSFTKEYPALTMMGSGLITGVLDRIAPTDLQKAQVEALKARAREQSYLEEQRAKFNQSVQGVNIPFAANPNPNVFSNQPVVAQPYNTPQTVYQPQNYQPGIIRRAM